MPSARPTKNFDILSLGHDTCIESKSQVILMGRVCLVIVAFNAPLLWSMS
jgi:hypothetical protein